MAFKTLNKVKFPSICGGSETILLLPKYLPGEYQQQETKNQTWKTRLQIYIVGAVWWEVGWRHLIASQQLASFQLQQNGQVREQASRNWGELVVLQISAQKTQKNKLASSLSKTSTHNTNNNTRTISTNTVPPITTTTPIFTCLITHNICRPLTSWENVPMGMYEMRFPSRFLQLWEERKQKREGMNKKWVYEKVQRHAHGTMRA